MSKVVLFRHVFGTESEVPVVGQFLFLRPGVTRACKRAERGKEAEAQWFGGYESVPESVLVSVPERLKRPGAIDCFTASASGGFLILDWQAASLHLLFKRLA